LRGINGNVSFTVIFFLFKHLPYFLITPRTLQVYCCYVNWHSVRACAIMVFKWMISRQITSRKKEGKKERKTIKLLYFRL